MTALECRIRSGEGRVHVPAADLQALRAALAGEVLTSADDGHAEACRVWNGMIRRTPALIARCRGAADVMRCVDFARQRGLLVSVRGGGHNVAGTAVCDGGLTIDLGEMRGVRVDPQAHVAWAQGGARLGDLDRETQAVGLAVPVGVVSATGLGGLALHGGLGWLGRKYGSTAENILSADVVTADGRLRRASPDGEADLLWAIRGGGGGFGVVTALELRAYPVGPTVLQVLMMHPVDRAREALRRYREYMPHAPEELALLAVLWSAGEEAPVPPEHHGAPVIVLVGCYAGDPDEGMRALRPLRELGEPIVDLTGPAPYLEVQKIFDPDYPDGRRYYWKSTFLRALDDATIDALLEHAASRPSPLTSLDIWAGGGALARAASEGTAFGAHTAPFMLGIEANWNADEDSDANVAWARGVYEDMRRRFDAGTYLNFPGFFEQREDLLRGAYGPNLVRLRQLKQRYDPENLFGGHLSPA